MNIVVIHGSMRRGNTYHLTQAVIARLKEHNDVDISEFDIKSLKLPFCISCHQCFIKGEHTCPHKDILSPIITEIEYCDALIISGVVYAMHLNAAMKNLIDHLAYYFHRPRLFDKKGMVITTTAGAGEKTVANYLKSVMGVWGISNIRELSFKIQNDNFTLTDKQQDQINKEVRNFYNIVSENITSAPSFNSVALYNSFRGMSTATRTISGYDKDYWQNTGLKHKVYPRKIGIVKTLFGTTVFKILKMVMDKK